MPKPATSPTFRAWGCYFRWLNSCQDSLQASRASRNTPVIPGASTPQRSDLPANTRRQARQRVGVLQRRRQETCSIATAVQLPDLERSPARKRIATVCSEYPSSSTAKFPATLKIRTTRTDRLPERRTLASTRAPGSLWLGWERTAQRMDTN